MLKIVVTEMPRLESLNISSTLVTDISPISRCRSHLQYLAMYNVRAVDPTAVAALGLLHHLRHLDVSTDTLSHAFLASNHDRLTASKIVDAVKGSQNLVSLDISGKQDISVRLLR